MRFNHRALILIGSLAAFAACNKMTDHKDTPASNGTGTGTGSSTTARGAVNPTDQGNNRGDLDTTQVIRRAIMQVDGLSSRAKNVQIVTEGGFVTLRGTVHDNAEKQAVEAAAKSAAGDKRVDNELMVDVN
jgi:osmotically-inducible protein OsmY